MLGNKFVLFFSQKNPDTSPPEAKLRCLGPGQAVCMFHQQGTHRISESPKGSGMSESFCEDWMASPNVAASWVDLLSIGPFLSADKRTTCESG